jgi:hypothetical protein
VQFLPSILQELPFGAESTASVPVGFRLNSGKKKDGDDRKCSSCLSAVGARP